MSEGTGTREAWLQKHADRRAAVVKMRSENMTYDEISAVLGGTPNAAKVLMKRARELGEAPPYDPTRPPARPTRRQPRHNRRINGAFAPARDPEPHEVQPMPAAVDDLVALDNQNLSYQARGMLLHLSSTYPPLTQVSSHRLVTSKEGQAAVRRVLGELALHGYLRRGRGTAWVWLGDPTRQLG